LYIKNECYLIQVQAESNGWTQEKFYIAEHFVVLSVYLLLQLKLQLEMNMTRILHKIRSRQEETGQQHG
jgi:hypothetical protein